MQAQLAGGVFEDHAGRLHRQGRQRIRLGTPRFERVRAGQAGDAQLLFGLGVVRLEIRVRDGPIVQTGAGHAAPLALLLEIRFPQAPVVGGEVDRAAAHLPSVLDDALGWYGGLFCVRLPVCVRLAFQVIGHGREHGVLDFVVLEILFAQVGTLLQNHYAEARSGKFLGHDAARPARADDQEIDFFGRLVLLHSFSCAGTGPS